MPLMTFTCEHCKEPSHRFLRPSQVRGTVLCPHCKKPITSGGKATAVSAPSVGGGQQVTCAKL